MHSRYVDKIKVGTSLVLNNFFFSSFCFIEFELVFFLVGKITQII